VHDDSRGGQMERGEETTMLCQACEHALSQHSPDSDETGSHSCDLCDCKGFVGPPEERD
jgi:hypothetical protein